MILLAKYLIGPYGDSRYSRHLLYRYAGERIMTRGEVVSLSGLAS